MSLPNLLSQFGNKSIASDVYSSSYVRTIEFEPISQVKWLEVFL